MNNWSFPKSPGQIRGVADAGIETFTGKELKSLAREICQNSLDACKDQDKAVRVDFSKHVVSNQRIPGFQDYKTVLSKALNYWTKQDVKKAMAFLTSANASIDGSACGILRISDYNTVGLKNPYSDDLKGWNALTKLDGGATKSEGSGGSFGIGKNAPFSNSFLRLVFYRTLNEAGERAAQGISRLFSYPEDADHAMASMTSGFGYYGDNEDMRNMPVPSIEELDSLKERDETGTDVFIYGFKSIGNDWESELTESLLDNFIVAFYKGKLEATVQKSGVINKENLLDFLKKNKCTDSENIYYILDKPADNKHYFEITRDFHGMGTLVLKVMVDPKKKLNHKIQVVRKAGMKLFWLPKASNMISYTGVLELQGAELNAYFGSMETPSHDKWEYKRHEENPAEAKQYYGELKQWVNDEIFNIANQNDVEETIVEGLGGILNEDLSNNGEDQDKDKEEALNDLLGRIEVVDKRPQKSKGIFHPSEEKPDKPTEKGKLGKDGDPAARTRKGKKGGQKRKSHRGVPDPNGQDLVGKKTKKAGGLDSQTIEKVRVVKTGGNSYVVSVTLPVSIGKGHIELTTVGENNKSSLLKVSAAKLISGCSDVSVAEDVIQFREITSGVPVKIGFTLSSDKNYALEVNVYEHN